MMRRRACTLLRHSSYLINTSHANEMLRPSPFLHTSSSPTFIRCLGASQRCLCGTSMSSKSTPTETKKAAFEIGKGAELVAFYSDHHVVNLPQGHRFPMDKYRATRLMLEDDASLVNLFITHPSPAVSIEELCLIHEERYVQSILNGELNEKEQRNLGFPWSPELVNRSRASIGGTVAAMHCVMLGLRSAAANIAGGTHHAFPGHGEGFCVFNDIAVAARVALEAYSGSCTLERPILVIDLDVHQAGVDALREDSFGRLAMTRQGLLQRNNMVYTACLTRELPLVITMGGGYSRPSEASVLAHADVYRAAALRYGAINRTSDDSKY